MVITDAVIARAVSKKRVRLDYEHTGRRRVF
jgi:hypothetical protein